MKKYILILIAVAFTLQGCTNKGNFSKEQLENITNSVTISDLEKVEFNVNDNKLIIYSNEEIINNEGFNTIIKSLKLNSLSGKQISGDKLSANEFDGKDFNVEIISKNGNMVSFNTKNATDKNYSIYKTKYSESFMKGKILNFSKNLIRFDELAGTIETDLNNNRDISEKIKQFNTIKENVNSEISYFKNLSAEITDYSKIDEVKNKVTRVKIFTDLMTNAVMRSIEEKKGTYIANNFLNINEIDRIARELEKM
ncbi:hypothetical protein HMPREF1983_00642 [Gemella bergeri ATCC 700627]|uniref:Lipoprotein n=1 Tax=Gemella bergeri ATCC 700627 TaxID=1321820 RepID=U2QS29_9BACL|nr:hypothetical protein [Gemella bergeri]ERK59004.1 hypothetical protein HMPREF1983_00642 [Gemella bergeri ATCC 700627]